MTALTALINMKGRRKKARQQKVTVRKAHQSVTRFKSDGAHECMLLKPLIIRLKFGKTFA